MAYKVLYNDVPLPLLFTTLPQLTPSHHPPYPHTFPTSSSSLPYLFYLPTLYPSYHSSNKLAVSFLLNTLSHTILILLPHFLQFLLRCHFINEAPSTILHHPSSIIFICLHSTYHLTCNNIFSYLFVICISPAKI